MYAYIGLLFLEMTGTQFANKNKFALGLMQTLLKVIVFQFFASLYKLLIYETNLRCLSKVLTRSIAGEIIVFERVGCPHVFSPWQNKEIYNLYHEEINVRVA